MNLVPLNGRVAVRQTPLRIGCTVIYAVESRDTVFRAPEWPLHGFGISGKRLYPVTRGHTYV